jgi:hypothetical protein
MKCLLCEDTGWVCEAHPDQPWEGPHACTCGGAGMPCPHAIGPPMASHRDSQQALNLMANKGWSKRFHESIVLDDGTTLTTLRQAIEYLAKTVPRAEHNHPSVLDSPSRPIRPWFACIQRIWP